MTECLAAGRVVVGGLGLAVALVSACREAEDPAAAAALTTTAERSCCDDDEIRIAPTARVPAAPAPEWTHEFAGDPAAVRIDADGRVFAIVDDETSGEARLVALQGGELRWSTTDAFAPRLAIASGELVTARRSELVAYDPASGSVRWSAVLPADVGEYGDEHPHVRAFVQTKDGWFVADAAGRTFTIAPGACKVRAAKRCVRATRAVTPVLPAEGPIDRADADSTHESVRELLFEAFKAGSKHVLVDVDDVHLDQESRMAVMGFERTIAVFELPTAAVQAAGAP